MEEKDIGDVLSNLAVDVVRNKDGRHLSEYDQGSLNTIAELAERLDLAGAEKFRTLSNTARKGFVKDIGAAALRILTSE